ncbi:MAG TPA: ABC transporter permease, partial [Propionicimonas sp.]|nr:ABC transporter permease [Propionicimonas sp.]
MLRQAWSEVRHHPGRFVSTILAIAISVAFLTGSAVLVATEGQAQGKAMNVSLAKADVVVTIPEDVEASVRSAITSMPGVGAVAPVFTESEVVTAGVVSQVIQLVNLPPEELRWAALTAGRWPAAVDEIALSGGAAKALGIGVDGQLVLSGRDQKVRVVGVTNEPSGLFVKTGYAADARFAAAGYTDASARTWVIKAAPGKPTAALAAGLDAAVKRVSPAVRAEPAERVRAEAVAHLARDFDVFSNVLWAFAVVSLVVGMITISNTFSITLAQRRRQIGLLRAVGATGGQVQRRFLLEAVLLGVAGSLLGLVVGIGIAAAETAWSTALFWGLSLPLD